MSNPYDRIRCSSGPPQQGAKSFLQNLAQHPLSKQAAQEAMKKFREAYPEISAVLGSSPIPIVGELFNKNPEQVASRLSQAAGTVKDAEFEVIE